MENKIREFLKKPYSRILIPDPETGRYAAQLLEFAGCFSEGATPQRAYKNLEQAAYNWLESAIKQGIEIPEPFSADGYSGKVALRMPKSLHRQAMSIARREGVSLNQFLVSAVASSLGAHNLYEKIADRLEAKSNVDFWYSGKAVNVVSKVIGSCVVSNATTGAVNWVPSSPNKLQWLEATSSSPESELIPESPAILVQ